MKPTLLILAAGMGSRYGSLKQMDGVGPNSEAILEYSIFDAIRAGFGKVVFVIRHSFEEDFKKIFNAQKFNNAIEVEYVFQDLSDLPEGFSVPEGREKPWGTNHAVMMGKSVIDTPFAVINADDFYGADAYVSLCNYLKQLEGQSGKYCMVGYKIENTLSDFGTVSRGVCKADHNNKLTKITECFEIGRFDGVISHKVDQERFPIEDGTLVSMNMFGYTPDYFAESDRLFVDFLQKQGGELKSEFLIPLVTDTLIKEGKATMEVLSTEAKWFGVTFKEDKPIVVDKIKSLIEASEYPLHLWEK